MTKEFFEYIPNTYYAFDDTQIVEMKHLFRRAAFIDVVKSNIKSFTPYTILEGETPDLLSYKFYGTTAYHWIILLFNDIIDPFGQWPMNRDDLFRYAKSKYGDSMYETGYYMNAAGTFVDPTHYLGVLQSDGTYDQDMIPVSNFEYEERINDSKRKIFIPKQEFIGKITSEMEKLF